MRIPLAICFIGCLAMARLAAQPSQSEEAYQHTKELVAKLQETNFDSSLTVLRAALNTFNAPHQKIELLIEVGRTFELKRQLDSALIVLERSRLLAEQHNREDLLVSALFNIGYTYNTSGEKQQALNFLHQSYQLASQRKDQTAQYHALSQLGRTFSSIAQADSAAVYLHKALVLAQQLENTKEQAWVLMVLGNNSARAKDITKALEYYHQSIDLAGQMKDYSMILFNYSNIAYTYAYNGNFPLALEYYQKGLKVAEDMESAGEQANMSIHLASVYISLNDLDQAIFYYEKADQLWEREGNANERQMAFERKGEVYLLKEDYRRALDQFLRSSQLIELTNKNLIEPSVLLNIGTCYEKLNQLDSAQTYYTLAINNASEVLSHKDIKAEGFAGLASINLTKGKWELALSNASQALDFSQERENDEMIMKASGLLYQIYREMGQDSQALQYYEYFQTLQDSLFSRQNIKQIAQLEAQNEFDRQKQQLDFERKQERQQARSRQLVVLIIAGSLGVFLVLSYRNVLAKKRANAELQALNAELAHQHAVVEGQKKQLEELDQMKSRFFTNISHEFRTPLTVIGGMIQQIKRSPNKWLEKGTQLIERNNTNLLNLVNQILDLRKLESGGLKVELIQGNVVFYLRYILESFHSLAESKRISLHFDSQEDEIRMDYDKEKLLRIVSNLLSNALKFTPHEGQVYLRVAELNTNSISPSLQITVQDTGIGIPQSKLPHIFDRFYQVDDSSTREGEGTGIGLALTKELVKLMQGQIEVSSPPAGFVLDSSGHTGSAFKVTLPITRNAPLDQSQVGQLPAVVLEESKQDLLGERALSPVDPDPKKTIQSAADPNRSTLLIIEDNPDLVEYLESLLSHQYDLEIARDGQEGIEIALEQIPDLILSDVMMPHKDGFEVCETLKNDQRTSHIPIVLLTAKADAESRIAGLKRGADAYLAKPFNQDELFVRLEKLHQLRLQLQARYQALDPVLSSPEPTLDTAEEVQLLTQAEDAFMQSLRAIVEANLDREDFAVPELCRAIGMSRSQLHRKIKALTNRSTTHYIRSIRLQKAKALLQQGDLNVTQVAYEVGFQNRTYFSRAFSEEFGISPKDFSSI